MHPHVDHVQLVLEKPWKLSGVAMKFSRRPFPSLLPIGYIVVSWLRTAIVCIYIICMYIINIYNTIYIYTYYIYHMYMHIWWYFTWYYIWYYIINTITKHYIHYTYTYFTSIDIYIYTYIYIMILHHRYTYSTFRHYRSASQRIFRVNPPRSSQTSPADCGNGLVRCTAPISCCFSDKANETWLNTIVNQLCILYIYTYIYVYILCISKHLIKCMYIYM